jgi:hypothetical protein
MSSAIFSFIGIVAGAMLQYFFTRHLDGQRLHREMRTKCYTDYLRSVSEQANLSGRRDTPEWRDLRIRTADAKCRICLYGSSAAISSFAEFERLGATMNSPEQRAAFTRMVLIMRTDSTSNSNVALKDLENIILGVQGNVT